MSLKIIIAGGTGFLGQSIVRYFLEQNATITVLTRGESRIDKNVTYVHWDALTQGPWTEVLNNADVIINLVGKSVNCRYTEENKKELIESRVNATIAIGEAINSIEHPPKLWINAGSAAIFGNSGDELKNESSQVGHGFSPEICKQWESAFNKIETPNTRKVLLRIGIVLQKNRGLLIPFTNLVKFGLGGRIGSGKQYFTWIHENDFLNVLSLVIEDKEIQGILNCSSPNPVTNEVFMEALRKHLGIPFGLPNFSFSTRIGALLMGTEADLVLDGRRVVSNILPQKQFTFTYPTIHQALHHLLS